MLNIILGVVSAVLAYEGAKRLAKNNIAGLTALALLGLAVLAPSGVDVACVVLGSIVFLVGLIHTNCMVKALEKA